MAGRCHSGDTAPHLRRATQLIGGTGEPFPRREIITKAQKLFNRRQDGFHDLVNGKAVQAAEINGAFAQEARRTRRLRVEQAMARVAGQAGAGEFRRGAAKRHHHRRAQGGGDVHGAGVVGEQHAAEFQ